MTPVGVDEAALDGIVAELAGGDGPGAILDVHWPQPGYRFAKAAGSFERGSDDPLRAGDAFRIASMSKPITAATALRMCERGLLSLDDRLGARLPAVIVERVHVRDGVPRGPEISLRQLLNHTAGLWDFAMSDAWRRELLSDPGRFRDPAWILDWALAHGEPVGLPGERYHYSDTGYVLVGHVLERVGGRPLAALSRELVLEPLGMDDTWLEGHEEPRGPRLSHCYAQAIDGLTLDGSVDWAAGGHVSTTRDLERLLRGLLEGKLFERAETRAAMLETVPVEEGRRYGLGIAEGGFGGCRLLGHSGFWGSFMYLLPESGATIIGSVNRAGFDRPELLDAVPAALGLAPARATMEAGRSDR